jgi:leucyl aminopeptidase
MYSLHLVLVGNTDAEGRMVMADLLADVGKQALGFQAASAKPCRIFTMATLTGHVIRAYGSYPACLDNGPARELGTSRLIFEKGAEQRLNF